MTPTLEICLGIVILVGLGGAVTQLYPGPLLVLAAVGVWGVVVGGPVGWSVLLFCVVVIALASVGKFVLMGRHLTDHEIPKLSIVVGALVGVAGFFLVPVVGLPLGFVLGVYIWEYLRLRSHAEAWQAAVVALKAQGIAILCELAGSLLATGAWIAGLFLT